MLDAYYIFTMYLFEWHDRAERLKTSTHVTSSWFGYRQHPESSFHFSVTSSLSVKEIIVEKLFWSAECFFQVQNEIFPESAAMHLFATDWLCISTSGKSYSYPLGSFVCFAIPQNKQKFLRLWFQWPAFNPQWHLIWRFGHLTLLGENFLLRNCSGAR